MWFLLILVLEVGTMKGGNGVEVTDEYQSQSQQTENT